MKSSRIVFAILLCALAARAAASERVLHAVMEVNAPAEQVFAAWTTDAGVRTFFAPGSHIEPRVDGAYDIYFNPDGEPGNRGAEGMRIVTFEPGKRVAFTWNAPPSIAAIRAQRTLVVLDFEAAGAGRTRVTFTQMGWGHGVDWDKAYNYFDRAWSSVVLPRLKYRFEKGPLDWAAPPKLEPLGPMQVELK